MTLIECEQLTREYRKGENNHPPARRARPRRARRRLPRAHGPQRQRQDDAAQPHRRHRLAHERVARDRRHRHRDAEPQQARGVAVAHVGYVFQLYNLVPVLTAYENVELPLLLHPLSRRERHERSRGPRAVGIADRARPLPAPALGRAGAARRHRAGDRDRPRDPRRRRADGRPRQALGPRGDEAAAAAQRELGKTIIMVTHDPHTTDYASARCTSTRAGSSRAGRSSDRPGPSRRCAA